MSGPSTIHRLLAVAFVVATVAGGALVVVEPSGAQEPVTVRVARVGWWTADESAEAPGIGGFRVAADSAGETTAYAAVEVVADAASISRAVVSLAEDSSAFSDAAGITACVTADGWSAADGGALADGPPPDCSASVALELVDGAWTGDVATLLAPGTSSLAFVPDYAPPLTVGFGMDVAIAAVTFDAAGAAPTTTTTTAPPATTAAPPVTSSPSPAPTSPAVVVAPPTTRQPSTATTAPPIGDPSDSNLAAPPPPVRPTLAPSPTVVDDGVFTLGPAQEFDDEGRPWGRVVILAPLSLAIGVGATRLRDVIADRLAT